MHPFLQKIKYHIRRIWTFAAGPDLTPLIDQAYYSYKNPDLAALQISPLEHYFSFGQFEGRSPNPLFDPEFYLERYPDAGRSFLSPLAHFMKKGAHQGRIPNRAGIPLHIAIPPERRKVIENALAKLSHPPLFSIIMNIGDVELKWLVRSIESVRDQLYGRWELLLAMTSNIGAETDKYLKVATGNDPRLKIIDPVVHDGSGAFEKALRSCSGDFLAFFEPTDLLSEDALYELAATINRDPGTDLVYCDQDMVDAEGWLTGHVFKPDWSPEYLRGVMYTGPFLGVRKSLFDAIGGLNSSFHPIEIYELILRLSEKTDRVKHIPRVLYHRSLTESMSEQRISSEEITALQVRAVADHLKRCSIPAQAQPHRRNARRVILQPAPRNDWPLISIVVSSTNCLDHIEQCLESIYSRSSYKNFEVILVGEGLRDSTAISCLSKYGIKLAIWDHHANVSRAFNLGVLQAGGDYLVFLNGNIEIVTPEWLETMLLYLEGPRIGAVGPLLIHPDNTVREAGIAFDGPPHYVRRIMTGFLSDCDGYEGCLSCAREVSAIGSDCMMLRRDTFIEAGGFEEYYEHDYQDIDLCLRVRNLSKSILLVPGAVLIHHGTSDRDVFGDVLDRALFLDLWNDIAEKGDTFHNAVQAAFEYRLRKECF